MPELNLVGEVFSELYKDARLREGLGQCDVHFIF